MAMRQVSDIQQVCDHEAKKKKKIEIRPMFKGIILLRVAKLLTVRFILVELGSPHCLPLQSSTEH